jgi:hypothetical protein
MTFPLQGQLSGHLFADLLGDATLPMSEWMGNVGEWLDEQSGGTAGQAIVKNSDVDGDFSYVDLAPLTLEFPLPNGTASPGLSGEAARSDHVHPSVGASGGVGFVQLWTSTNNGTDPSDATVININPSPVLLNGHHYMWSYQGEWTDSGTVGNAGLDFVDGDNSDATLSRTMCRPTNSPESRSGFYLEDGTGVAVHRKLFVRWSGGGTLAMRGDVQPYTVVLTDLGNQ